MSDDVLAGLAARSARVRNENRLLLEGLRSFEQKLIELVAGLGCSGNSEIVTFEEFIDAEGDVIGDISGFLSFDGKELWVASKEEPHPGFEESYWSHQRLKNACVEWQRKLSDRKVLDSLVVDLGKNLEREFEKTTSVVQSLTQFLTVEKAKIDEDLDAIFSRNSAFLDSWLKARSTVLTDPEQSITLSCSHIETVLKWCLKTLGATGYQTLAVEKLMRTTLGLLKAESVIDGVTAEMLQGAITMGKSIGETRNFRSSSHGKDEGYVPPPADLAQLANHLAGVVSVFVMKQTDLVMQRR